MSEDLLWKVKEGDYIKLKDYDPDHIASQIDRDAAEKQLQKLSQELGELQELMTAAQKHSFLMILQGMDTSGKDGTIRHVLSSLNPQGCQVHSFKAPSQDELQHDFLWRIHQHVPPRGMFGVFNRSHYEDVLIVRVHNLVPESTWRKRYHIINAFEEMLTESNTIVVKFFLHISKDEQARRLKAREDEPEKSWKLSVDDWKERQFWGDYQEAYEDALSKCSTKQAPWYIVPANHKWYRNLAIAQTLADTLKPYKDEWQKDLLARGQRELEALKQMHIRAEK
ncbi:polyphosphate kinase 2 family protein [Ktedonobacter racemifer]|uniref:Polyphosphate kinase-2-related domain-containing protein n=1 Tax=Ktedonobacter racemifer DSM 44963 TaxID=485913 RepID=D6TFD3_KTERA|nr:polyphosphate kinase 2 family protein [Ktedonobacter racemifer]EFH88613.1 protein of unknown function DUF344 [Ktedonobacter racemifer DSM 44963]